MMEGDAEKSKKVLKIIGIYETNSFEEGLRLKTSRFNHSCWPNAYVHIEHEIRATNDIKVGQEIIINYRLIIFSVHLFFDSQKDTEFYIGNC